MKKKICAFLLMCSLSTYASDGLLIDRIEVSGQQRVETQVVLDYFAKKPDKSYTREDLDDFLKCLFKTGLFQDVQLDVKGQTLVVRVKENQFLNQVAFEGNKDATDDDLKTVVTLKPRQVFTPARVREAEQAIIALYRTKGRYGVRVKAELIHHEFNRVDLIFKIDEGPKAFIRDIFFVGHKTFSESTLSKIISSKEERWYRFFGPPEELYNPERVKYDEDLLRQFYLKNGFVDIQVLSSQGELTPNHENFVVTFTLSEGQRYRFGKTSISSELAHVNVCGLIEEISWTQGEWFNSKAVQTACDDMGRLLSERGVPFVEVVPVTEKNGEAVDIQFVIKSTPHVYVDTITMRGNLGTDDQVLRQELSFAEGDPLSPAKINESEKKLEGLDFFETVEIIDAPSQCPNRRHVTVKVKEKSTGDVQFGGGYSSVDGPVARLGLTERNFLGKGKAVNFSAYLAKRGLDLDLGTRIPYFMGRRMTFGTDVSYSRYRGDTRGTFSNQGGYKQQSGGVAFSVNYALRKNIYQGWSYKIRREQMRLRHENMSPYLIANVYKKETLWLSGVGHNLFYDQLNKKTGDAVNGWFAQMNNDWMGTGGNIHFLSNTVRAEYYYSFDEDGDYLLRLEASYGAITKLGYMRFSDQFYLGGFRFPGFAEAGIGPVDTRTRDSLGGRQYYSTCAKMYFPLGLPKDLPVKGVAYIQSGSLWSPMFKGPYIASSSFKNRLSVGAGVIWTLPFLGRIGLVASKALMKQKYDNRQTLLFIWGQEF